MASTQENVLVVERKLLERCGMFQGLTFAMEKYLPVLLNSRNYRFVPRDQAETDPSLKQLIPYFILCCGDKIWTYVRGKKSGEGRLVAKGSIGIGGHINHLDENLFEDIYSRAAAREVEEEVVLPPGCTHRIVALLNDDATPVGQVHLGVVHVMSCPTPGVKARESALIESGFKAIPDIQSVRESLETWSQICLDRIDILLEKGLPSSGA